MIILSEDVKSISRRTSGRVQAEAGTLEATVFKAQTQVQPLSKSTGRQSRGKTVDAELELAIDLEHDEVDDEEEVDAMIEVDETEVETEAEVEEPHRKETISQPKHDQPKVQEGEDADFWRFGMKDKEPDATPRRASRHDNPQSKKKGKASITRAR
ncbi:hypothetical protein H0H92_015610, partial [Tricholoma furcatifolium]